MIHAGAEGFAEPALQPAVQTLAQKAFAQKTEANVRQFFEKNIATLPNAQAKAQALTLLADYEQHNGNYSNAADYYQQAADFDTTDEKTTLLLNAVCALLCTSNFDSARSLLSKITATLPASDDNPYYRRAAVYDTWRLLAEDKADRAIPLIIAYTKKKAFSEYHPALLFTLWWVNGDKDAKQRLLKEFPSSMETAAVNSSVTVQPSTFWYLMPRSGIAQQSAAAKAALTQNTLSTTETAAAQPPKKNKASLQSDIATTQSPQNSTAHAVRDKPVYYQLGFYRTKKYAEALAADLQKKHFTPIIKEETRPSGTLYFAVLVKENAAGDMGLRLKDAGYEAFPIFP